MTEAEQRGIDYLSKLRKSPYVKKLIFQHPYKEMSLTSQDEWADWQELDIDFDKHL